MDAEAHLEGYFNLITKTASRKFGEIPWLRAPGLKRRTWRRPSRDRSPRGITLVSVLVLMYHSISYGPGPTCIEPEAFQLQMSILEETGYRVVSLIDLLSWMHDTCELPDRCVALTFDDGFADFAKVAFPELHRRGWPATVFLPAGHVGGFDHWETPSRSGHGRSWTGRRSRSWPRKESSSGATASNIGTLRESPGLPSRPSPRLEAGDRRPNRSRGHQLRRPVRPVKRRSTVLRRHYRMAVGTTLAQPAANRTSTIYRGWDVLLRPPRRLACSSCEESREFPAPRRFLRRVRKVAARSPRPARKHAHRDHRTLVAFSAVESFLWSSK